MSERFFCKNWWQKTYGAFELLVKRRLKSFYNVFLLEMWKDALDLIHITLSQEVWAPVLQIPQEKYVFIFEKRMLLPDISTGCIFLEATIVFSIILMAIHETSRKKAKTNLDWIVSRISSTVYLKTIIRGVFRTASDYVKNIALLHKNFYSFSEICRMHSSNYQY